jgi:hypothetical protein
MSTHAVGRSARSLQTLFNGNLYDAVCRFEPAGAVTAAPQAVSAAAPAEAVVAAWSEDFSS